MYNKAKYLTGFIGAILAIVLGSLITLTAIISMISLMASCASVAGKANVSIDGGALAISVIGLFMRLAIGIIILIFGIRTVGKPWLMTVNPRTNAKIWVYSSKGKDITLIVFGGIMFFLGILAGSLADFIGVGFVVWLQWIQNILALGVMVLKLVSVCLRGEQSTIAMPTATQGSTSVSTPVQTSAQNSAQPSEHDDSIENKLKELKHLRDLAVIDEEQYKAAVKKLFNI